jgi:hypothetical protein
MGIADCWVGCRLLVASYCWYSLSFTTYASTLCVNASKISDITYMLILQLNSISSLDFVILQSWHVAQ